MLHPKQSKCFVKQIIVTVKNHFHYLKFASTHLHLLYEYSIFSLLKALLVIVLQADLDSQKQKFLNFLIVNLHYYFAVNLSCFFFNFINLSIILNVFIINLFDFNFGFIVMVKVYQFKMGFNFMFD